MTPIPIREAEATPARISSFQLTNKMAQSHFLFPFSWGKIQSLEKTVKKRGFPLTMIPWRKGRMEEAKNPKCPRKKIRK